jgi:hypothetical protein
MGRSGDKKGRKKYDVIRYIGQFFSDGLVRRYFQWETLRYESYPIVEDSENVA